MPKKGSQREISNKHLKQFRDNVPFHYLIAVMKLLLILHMSKCTQLVYFKYEPLIIHQLLFHKFVLF